MKKLIKVTKEHIKKAKEFREVNKGGAFYMMGFCKKCPVALALQDAGLDFIVGSLSVFKEFNIMQPHPLPRSAKRFINKYDHYKPVKPFNFYLQF